VDVFERAADETVHHLKNNRTGVSLYRNRTKGREHSALCAIQHLDIVSLTVYNTQGTRAHTHRELIRKWLWKLHSFIVGVNHPSSIPRHLRSLPYCNTIARPLRNIGPPTDPPVTPYHIADGNIVYMPSRVSPRSSKIEIHINIYICIHIHTSIYLRWALFTADVFPPRPLLIRLWRRGEYINI